MTCGVAFCTAEAVGEWRWAHLAFVHYPVCDEHVVQKQRSKAPGSFTPYKEQVA